MDKLRELIKLAIEDFHAELGDDPDDWPSRKPDDLIWDLADNMTPVYTGDLMELAAENIWIAVTEPELGPAFDGSNTPANLVAANVFEHIREELHKEWESMLEEVDDN